MGRIPLEDNFNDVIAKAQLGLGIDDDDLARRAQVTPKDIASLKAGRFDETVARRVASHLRLNRDALVRLALKQWYPAVPAFPTGFAAFNTPDGDCTANSYLVWDGRSRHAAAFDTGTDATPMLEFIRSERLNLRSIFITHAHHDHVGGLAALAAETKAEVWSSPLEPLTHPGAKTFTENAFFHLGPLAVKTLFTAGHSPGGTTFYVTGLSWPVAFVGDSLFSCSIGGAPAAAFATAVENNFRKILTLPADTVLACGHGPLTTVAQERRHNPFFVR